MPINSQTISNGNGNNMAGRDIINNYYSSDEHIDLYENDIRNLIEIFDANLNIFDDNPTEVVEGGKYDFTEKERKNQLNNLSNDYFNILCDDFLPYFYKIDNFLKNPQNKKLYDKYKNVSLYLKATIEANRRKYDKFEEIISDVTNKILNVTQNSNSMNSALVSVFLNYMYWNCDIGRRR